MVLAAVMQLERQKKWGGVCRRQGPDREEEAGARIELSVQVMIRRHRCGHVRNEFHAC